EGAVRAGVAIPGLLRAGRPRRDRRRVPHVVGVAGGERRTLWHARRPGPRTVRGHPHLAARPLRARLRRIGRHLHRHVAALGMVGGRGSPRAGGLDRAKYYPPWSTRHDVLASLGYESTDDKMKPW